MDAACRLAGAIYETASTARRLKAENNLASNRSVKFILVPSQAIEASHAAALAQLAGAAAFTLADATPANAPKMLSALGELALPLEGLIDVAAESARLAREITRIEGEIKKCAGKLANPSFIDRAPPEVVAQENARMAEWEEKLATTRRMLENLKA